MKPSNAANLALIIVIFGWSLMTYGVLSQLGDPAPWVTDAKLAAHRKLSIALTIFGLFALLSALWLSGYGYSTARWRSIIALTGCIIPAIALVIVGYSNGSL